MRIFWLAVCVTALAGVGGTGLGGLASCLFRRDSSRTVSLLLSFAAGVMTAVVCFDLLTDAMEPDNAAQPNGLGIVTVGVLLGYGAIFLLNGWIDRRTAIDGGGSSPARISRGRGGLFLAGLVMAAAIALHNMPEGMVIGASFARDSGTTCRDGLVMAAVIGLHNIPEGMAVAVPLISGGMSRPKAVLTTAVTGAPTILGAVAGYSLGALGPLALALCLSFASGAMLYVVFGELLPEAAGLWKSKLPALAAVVGMLTGLAVVYA